MRCTKAEISAATMRLDDVLVHRFDNGSEAIFLPSFHNHHEFARLARELGGDTDAVAIELPDAVAAEYRVLIEELAPDPRGRLPGVFGLVRVVRRAASARARPGVLNVVPVISTDSMCEAVRGALELGLPVYGIDLDQAGAAPRREDTLPARCLPDASRVQTVRQLARWVARSSEALAASEIVRADAGFDARNLHMARRLLELAGCHGRILTVIGLAHLAPLKRLLASPELVPLRREDAPVCAEPVRRVVLDPRLAIPHMDRFPRLVARFDDRRTAWRDGACPRIDAWVSLREAVGEGAEALSDPHSPGHKVVGWALSASELRTFWQLLADHSAVAGESIPRLRTLLDVAGASADRFVAPLAEAAARYPWVHPEGESCPMLGVVEGAPRDGFLARLDGVRYRVAGGADIISIPGTELGAGRTRRFGSRSSYVTWPVDCRVATMCAMRIAALSRFRADDDATPESHRFSDGCTLFDGIDVRQTLRQAAAGEPHPLVVRRVRPSAEPCPGCAWPYPILFVFDAHPADGEWRSSSAFMSRSRDKRVKNRYHHPEVSHGTCSYRSDGIATDRLDCVAHLSPPIWGDPDLLPGRQIWREWLEDGHVGEGPLGGQWILEIFPELDSGPTPAHGLARLCFHYARAHVNVVLPDAADDLMAAIGQMAAACGKSVRFFTHGDFEPAMLRRVARPHSVPWVFADDPLSKDFLGMDGTPAPGVEAAMGESSHKYLDANLDWFGGPA